MHSLNKVTLIGNVGRPPEFRSTADGKEIVTFSIATTESWKDRATGEKKDRTEWHRIVVFSEGLVGIVKEYVKKGSKLYIEGALQTRKWTDASGQEKYTTEVVLQMFNSNLILLDNRNVGGSSSDPQTSKSPMNDFNHSELDDEIPF